MTSKGTGGRADSVVSFCIEPLESRQHLTAAPLSLAPMPSQRATPLAVAMTPSISNAQRQSLLNGLSPSLAASLAKTLRHSGPDAFDISLLDYMRRRRNVLYFFNGKLLNRVFARDAWRNGNFKANARADAVMLHRFPAVLGTDSFNVQLPTQIDWDTAPKGYGDNFINTLNRHVYWRDLAFAYRSTGDPKYVRELIAQLQSWSDQTRPLTTPDAWPTAGPGWNLLTTSDRVRNWIYAWQLVLGTTEWTPAANTLFLARLTEQANFLYNVTPDSFRKNKTGTHAAGLLELGLMFPEFVQSAQWESRGLEMTFRCMDAQFYPDGGHIEESPAYARTTLDSMFENFLLARINGKQLWSKSRRRQLTRGVEALLQLTSAYGQLPPLSDTYRSASITPFFSTAALALGEQRFGFGPPQTLEDLLVVEAHPELGSVFSHPGELKSINRGDHYAMPDSGYYVLRDPEIGLQQIVFDAGPKGYSHGHYDLFNFEFYSGYNLVADPGPYAYDDSPQRAYAISTPAHNTLSIDGLNHDAIEGPHDPRIVVDEFTAAADEARITAHHYAYASLAGSPVVGRTLWMDTHSANAIIIDWVRSSPAHPHTFTSSLNFIAPKMTQVAPGMFDAAVSKTNPLRVQTLLSSGQTAAVNDIEITDSPGKQIAAKRYAVSQNGSSAVFITLLSQHTLANNAPMDPRPAIPPASIALDAPLKKGQPIQIALTMPGGAVRHLAFPPPNLAPL